MFLNLYPVAARFIVFLKDYLISQSFIFFISAVYMRGMANGHCPRAVVNGSNDEYQLDKMTAGDELDLFCPINYVYDYLPQEQHWLRPQPIALISPFTCAMEKDPMLIQPNTRMNGIALHPMSTKLPLHTGLRSFRQSKHWRANEEATRELLELFSHDQRCKDAILANGQSMASLAKSQLKSSVLDTYSRFSIYIFPDGDEKRIQLLAQSVILIFIFDGETILFLRSQSMTMRSEGGCS